MTWSDRPRTQIGGLAVHTAGNGPPVLLLHGVGLRAEAWAPAIDALAGRFRVLAPDMPGHGASAPLPPAADLAQYAAALLPLLTAPTIVVGHSMGAMIALHLAALAPARVTAVAALNAVFERDAQAHAAVRARAAALDGRTPADPAATLARWFGAEPSPERAACQRWLKTVDPAGYKAAYTVFAHENGPDRAALAALACPALFMTGDREPNSTPAMTRAMADLAPWGVARIVAGAAHMMPMTHPAENIAAVRALAHRAPATAP